MVAAARFVRATGINRMSDRCNNTDEDDEILRTPQAISTYFGVNVSAAWPPLF